MKAQKHNLEAIMMLQLTYEMLRRKTMKAWHRTMLARGTRENSRAIGHIKIISKLDETIELRLRILGTSN